MGTTADFLTEDFDIEVLGHRLRVQRLTHVRGGSSNSGPTLVFLHEALGSIELWRDFPGVLAGATGCEALIYDRLGHGRSDVLTTKRTLRYVHDEALVGLSEVLRICKVDDSVLIGHSDGGSISLIFAAEHPDLVRGIISEAAHVFVDELTLSGIRHAVDHYENGNLKKKLMRYHGDNTDSIFRAWCDTWLLPEFTDWNIENSLPRVRCPVLVIQGEDDQYGTREQVKAIASQVAGPSRSLLVPNCAHIPHHQARDTVLQAMTQFILGLL
jgi:pimeloyl-ACP methyl ester carboxylesterase